MKRRVGLVSVCAVLLAAGCGKKGPPLPPLITLPAAPGDFVAARRGAAVAIQFAVPGANMDGHTPADVARVDVYAMTGPSTVTPDEIIKRGTVVGSVAVNPARDPEEVDEGKAPRKTPVRLPDGLEQGAVARLAETLATDTDVERADRKAGDAARKKAPEAVRKKTGDKTDEETDGKTDEKTPEDAREEGPEEAPDVRSYLAVGINRRGRRGAVSARALVPLTAPPAAPGQPAVAYDETSITVTWEPPAEAADREVPYQYNVYVPGDVETRLTPTPAEESTFLDARVEWGAERCYVVRTVDVVETLVLESDASPVTCVTLVDTFPPGPPVGLKTIASEGAVDLIWDPNTEADLAGYLVLRAMLPASDLAPVTPAPLKDTTFRDTVPPGARVLYAIEAVDTAGNISPMSESIEETAR